ncbi:adhesion G protein-coupled receptor F5-like [Clarias gariepinus]|uniref:adhesion G protein-coupled receptor F5-like n=1 Tax=Clarias gariepinus TaxID=13013 RepID=UPI00234C64B7|nr:adhesion G protein-coupled receptor F5-like [Clarias gariepinus]
MKINMTTVCQLIGIEYQCTCQDQYFWSLDNCAMYGTCNYANENACTCINALPSDGQMCVPTSELPIFYYLVEFKINTENTSVINEGRNFLGGVNLPFFFGQVAEITDVEMTTVCSLIGAEYHCWCEDQYFWPCEKCTIYGPCDDVNNSTCGCINGLPDDEQLCQPINELSYNSTCPPNPTRVIGDSLCPPNPLKAKYLIEFEINAVDETVLNQLRALLEILSVPFIISNINFTEIDITTVCRLNGSQYQCRCEDQYFWPCEKCTLYGSCGEITNTSCDCITAHPNGGQFCQPNNELTNNFACIIQPITTTVSTTTAATKTSFTLTPTSTSAITATTAISSKPTPTPTSPASTTTTAVPPRTTTSIATASTQTSTTTTTATSTTTQNSTTTAITNAVNTTNAVTKTNTTPTTTPAATSATTTIFTKPTTTPIANSTITTTLFKPTTTPTPTATSTTTTTLTKPTSTTTPTPITTTAGTQLLTFTLSIIEDFDFELSDQTSAKYKTYKAKIETSINLSYRTVSGYVANSSTVTNFRPGSVLADFTIQTTSVNLNLVSANENLASSLRLQGFNVSESAFSQSVKDGLYKSSGNIYPGTNLILTCNPPVNNGLTWTLNGGPLPQSDNILQLNNAAPNNSGQYACTTKVNSMPYVIWQVITIHPYPNIQVTSNKLVQCQDTTVPLQCCVQSIYQVEWGSAACSSPSKNPVTGCISCDYPIIQTNCMNNEVAQVTCQLQSPLPGSTTQSYNSKSITLNIINKTFDCFDNVFGAGNVGVESTGNCSGGMVGYQVAQCISPNIWNPIENYCVLPIFKNLQDTAKTLQAANIPQFMANLSTNALLAIQNITASSATILTIVDILNIISNLSQTILINPPVMNNFLQTTDVIGSDGAQSTWVLLNSNNTTKNASSELLKATEIIATRLSDGSFFITTNISSLNKTFITAPFSGTFGLNSTTQINIPVASAQTSLTVIISSAFNNILPVRNLTNNDSSQTGTIINGDVAVIETNSTIKNISLSFNIKNMTLGNPQCVFWNYSLLNGIGGWDSTGCQLMPLENETEIVTCECNHTTSFSILMSPFTLDNDSAIILNYITYIGVAISLGCLVLCLLIEIIIWKSVTRNDTSYMRHVSIVNIALSLLIADICFIIGAAVVNQGEGPCSTATFFMHFFYLALFFWMLLSALLLLYRTLMVFSRMTRGAMMAIAFTVGYGAPLIIAVVTVASTAGQHGYIQKQYNCWLNWSQTKALLAFVIPVLTVVAINFLVLIVVLFKMLRRGANASIQQDEKHPLVVIARCVAILTPLFGLTWGFGIGTLVSPNRGIHIVFAFFNSLQGFFILVFGTLLDSKVREALAGTFSLKNFSSYRTRSTSGGPSSSSGFPFFQRMRQRNAYNISSGGLMSSSSSATDT